MSERPEWKHALSPARVEKLCNAVIRITTHRDITGVDTCNDYVMFHTPDGGKFKPVHGWDKLFEFRPDYPSLIRPTWAGEAAIKTLREIDKWEGDNAADRAKYEKLKAKFEGKGETT